MAAQTWSSLRQMLLAALVKAQPDYTSAVPDFDVLFPQATSYAEGRIFHDVPLLGETQTNATLTTALSTRSIDTGLIVNANGGPIIVPEQFNLLVGGTRIAYDRSARSIIDQVWPVEAQTQAPSLTTLVPRLWAYRDSQTSALPTSTNAFAPVLIYCPTADGIYTVELVGLFQPTPLSQANPQTYLLSIYPELFEAACMMWLTGYLTHNFGAQSGDPRESMSHEAIYQSLIGPIKAEEARRRGLTPDIPMAQGAAR